MKILFVTCFDSPDGQSNRSYLFAKELDKIGHNITYFTNKYNHLDDHKRSKVDLNLDNNIKHIFADNKNFKDNKIASVILNCFTLLKILKKNKFDIIISSSVPLLNSFFALIAKKKATKFFFDLRDVWPNSLFSSGKISRLNPIYIILKLMEIIIYKYSDGLISALPDSFNYINRYNKNLPQIYVPNAYKPYPRYRKKFNKNKLRIIYIGRFNHNHDIKIILQSAKYFLYKKKINNISFDIYGYGDNLMYIKNYISKNNLINVNLKGKVPKHKIYSFSKKYDLALCTITNSQCFQWGINLNKIYEYFNSSMPVIFSGDVPLNPVKHACCGYICNDFNFINLSKKILKFDKLNDNEKRKLSTNAKNFFNKKYNLKLQTIKIEKFLKSLLIPI